MSEPNNPKEEDNKQEKDDQATPLNHNMRDRANRPETAILSSSSLKYLRRQGNAKINRNTTSLADQHEIILVIRGIVERVVLRAGTPVILGRADVSARSRVTVDLTQYGAVDRGVSREHCQLTIEDNIIFITDLGSTNGTYVAGKQIVPETPTQLRKGDELVLGRLPVQVLFR